MLSTLESIKYWIFQNKRVNVEARELIVGVAVFSVLMGALFLKYSWVVERKKAFHMLGKVIHEDVGDFYGKAGIYIKDLKSNTEIHDGDNEVFQSASLIKMPIMVAVFQAVNDGYLKLDDCLILLKRHRAVGSGSLKLCGRGTRVTVAKLVELMITESDNTATNMLTERLGFNYINYVFKEKLDLHITTINRRIMDLGLRKYGIDNYTTAKEIGSILEKIYKRKLISEFASDKMLQILFKQKTKDRIPRFLPKNLIIAHKTGFLREVCHDAGIIFTENGDFLICVLTSDFRSLKLAKTFIGELAYRTYLCY